MILNSKFKMTLPGIRRGRKQNSKLDSGFTLVELLMAMAIFLILLSVAVTAFVNAIRTQRAIVALMEVNDNASLTLEQMARELRTGRSFMTPSSNEIKFTNASDVVVYYRLNNNAIERGEGDAPGTVYSRVTADTINVMNFRVLLLNDVRYPTRITIGLTVGSISKYLTGVLTNIQTSVSARTL